MTEEVARGIADAERRLIPGDPAILLLHALLKRAEAAEAQLQAQAKLVERWRSAARDWEADGGHSWKVETYFDCAAELEAILTQPGAASREPKP